MVARIAAFWHGWPHEVWRFPLHYYLELKREYLAITGLSGNGPTSKDVEIAPGVTVEHYDTPD